MDFIKIHDFFNSFSRVPPLQSACISSILMNKISTVDLPLNLSHLIKIFHLAPGWYNRKEFVIKETGKWNYDDCYELPDKGFMVCHTEDFLEWLFLGDDDITSFVLKIFSNEVISKSKYSHFNDCGMKFSCYYNTWVELLFLVNIFLNILLKRDIHWI